MEEPKDVIQYHKNGNTWYKGQMLGDQMHGYWEWFTKDGKLMRSGYYHKGIQVGEWKTYDKKGKVLTVTMMKPPETEAEDEE